MSDSSENKIIVKHGHYVENPKCKICGKELSHEWLAGDYTLLLCDSVACNNEDRINQFSEFKLPISDREYFEEFYKVQTDWFDKKIKEAIAAAPKLERIFARWYFYMNFYESPLCHRLITNPLVDNIGDGYQEYYLTAIKLPLVDEFKWVCDSFDYTANWIKSVSLLKKYQPQ